MVSPVLEADGDDEEADKSECISSLSLLLLLVQKR